MHELRELHNGCLYDLLREQCSSKWLHLYILSIQGWMDADKKHVCASSMQNCNEPRRDEHT